MSHPFRLPGLLRWSALLAVAAAVGGCAVYPAYPEPGPVAMGPAPGVVYAPAPVYGAAPVYVAPPPLYYAPPVYYGPPPVSLSLGLGLGYRAWGGRHHHHRGRR